jgi:glycosyltransferase involved in cell wall biosynthesis
MPAKAKCCGLLVAARWCPKYHQLAMAQQPKVLYLVTEDWYFCSHRLPVARAARDAGMDVVVATRVGRDAARIEGEGFRLIPIDLRRRERRPWRELRVLREIVGLFRRERPTLAHLVAMKPILYGSIAARLTSVPAVVNAFAGLGYAYSSHSADAAVLRWFLKLSFRLVLRFPGSYIVVQNEDDADELVRLGIPEDRISIIRGSGIDLRRFAPTPEPAGEPIVTMVSRLLWDKGIGELVEAARLLRQQHPGMRIRLVGSPDPENPASIGEDRLREWCREGLVEWSGPVDDVPTVWKQSHVAVLPSYREGTPKSLLEAAACGRPIVTTDVPGCRQVVREGVNGLLVPVRDSRRLAEAIARLVADKALRERMGASGRQLMEREFSQERVATETLRLYRAALGSRCPA